MATSVMQVRVDDDLRAKAAAVYEELGIDLPTAFRMFLKRSVFLLGLFSKSGFTQRMLDQAEGRDDILLIQEDCVL